MGTQLVRVKDVANDVGQAMPCDALPLPTILTQSHRHALLCPHMHTNVRDEPWNMVRIGNVRKVDYCTIYFLLYIWAEESSPTATTEISLNVSDVLTTKQTATKVFTKTQKSISVSRTIIGDRED